MLHYRRFFISCFTVLFLASCASSDKAGPANFRSVQQEEVVRLITQMPADSETESRWILNELLSLGPGAIGTAVDMLVPPGAGDDTYARYAVNGLARYVSRPGAESGRKIFETVILEKLQSDISKPVKVFLIKQLELTGRDSAVNQLQAFLTDEVLCDPAAQALTVIGTPAAANVLHQALSSAGSEQKVTIIKALGDLQALSAASDILPYADSEDEDTKGTALYALASIGQPVATDVFSKAVAVTAPNRHTKALPYYLLFMQRLSEEGYTQQSTSLARSVLADDHPVHVKSAALSVLVKNEGESALEDIVAAVENGDPQLRKAALSLAQQLSGTAVTDGWIDKLNQSTPEVQADIITMIGNSSDSTVLPELRPFLQHANPQVRLATIRAITALGGSGELPALMDALHQSTEPEETEALKTALLQIPSEDLLPAVSEELPASSDRVKIVLIRLLETRQATEYLSDILSYSNHQNESVRRAVFESLKVLATPDDLSELIALLTEATNEEERMIIQDAIASVSDNTADQEKSTGVILAELEQVSGEHKGYLLSVLPEIGGEDALGAVVKATQSSDQNEQNAAVGALAAWPEVTALPFLLDVMETSTGPNSLTALEGYVRLIDTSRYSSVYKTQLLKDAAKAAESHGEEAIIIKALAELQSAESLKMIAGYLNHREQSIKNEAVRAIALMLATQQHDSASSLDSSNGILSVIEATASPQLRQQIEQQIREIHLREREAEEFTSLLNGRDLSGWIGATDAYYVEDGNLISLADASGNLYTENEYSDFVLRFEFKLTEGANSGLGIRAPLKGDAAYVGMELQILDNSAEQYAELKPWQYHGSVYGVVPAKRGHLRPAGEWNEQEVIARGSHITIRLNGETIVDADVIKAATPATADGREHPGLKRSKGHIGFLGHGSRVEFRNIRIKDLTSSYSSNNSRGDGLNRPPEGFKALFNGRDLTGWKGLVGDPETRAEMTPQELTQKQAQADSLTRAHWSVNDGVLYFDGEGSHLVTDKDYGDFEMLVDWKIEPGGDSGIYLRGSPQVQIWDVTEWPQGSGGLYNNRQNSSDPLMSADNPVGEWNRMRIKMIGERVTVHLNDQLVVENVVMENYWNRDKPIYPIGPIELQSHSTPLQFKNIFIREIPRAGKVFNGRDLSGWKQIGSDTKVWNAADNILYTEGGGGGWLSTDRMYDNFKLEFEYRLPQGGNSGIFLRAPHEGNPAYAGMEIQLLDDYAEQYRNLEPWQYTGSIYGIQAPSKRASKQAGQWQKMVITADGPIVKVTLNGEQIISANLTDHMEKVREHPGLKRRSGYIGLQNHGSRVEFRNITITEINRGSLVNNGN